MDLGAASPLREVRLLFAGDADGRPAHPRRSRSISPPMAPPGSPPPLGDPCRRRWSVLPRRRRHAPRWRRRAVPHMPTQGALRPSADAAADGRRRRHRRPPRACGRCRRSPCGLIGDCAARHAVVHAEVEGHCCRHRRRRAVPGEPRRCRRRGGSRARDGVVVGGARVGRARLSARVARGCAPARAAARRRRSASGCAAAAARASLRVSCRTPRSSTPPASRGSPTPPAPAPPAAEARAARSPVARDWAAGVVARALGRTSGGRPDRALLRGAARHLPAARVRRRAAAAAPAAAAVAAAVDGAAAAAVDGAGAHAGARAGAEPSSPASSPAPVGSPSPPPAEGRATAAAAARATASRGTRRTSRASSTRSHPRRRRRRRRPSAPAGRGWRRSRRWSLPPRASKRCDN